MVLMDGKQMAAEIKAEVRDKVARLQERGVRPCLAVVRVGENPASQVYVRNKQKDCEEVGIQSLGFHLPEETTQAALLELIHELNARDSVHGILVQLPLPRQIDEKAILYAIDPKKDVDCFHPYNVGRLQIGEPVFLPCTPAGVMEMIRRSGLSVEGKNCVVVGRSNIVGKPMALLLLAANGTVTVCHSKTQNLKEVCRQADVLVAAVGKRNTITADMVKPGAIVVDVGMNRNDEGKLCGDVDFAAVSPIAGAITPVPGGVGPMTRAMLLVNCLTAAEGK